MVSACFKEDVCICSGTSRWTRCDGKATMSAGSFADLRALSLDAIAKN